METAPHRILGRPRRVLALYTLVTLALTYPLAARLSIQIPHGRGDLWQNLWNFWHWRELSFGLAGTPYWTERMFHPEGTSLAFHTHSPLNILATFPVSLWLGPEAAQNLALLAGFVFAAFGTYLLVRDRTGEPRAAFAAGLIFAFSPMHLEQSLEHLNLASLEFVPLFFLFLLRTLERGSPGAVLGLGLSTAANALVCWQYGVLAGAIALALFVFQACCRRGDRPLGATFRDLALAGGLAVLISLPFAWPMLSEVWTEGLPRKPFPNRGVDPVFLFLPSDHHPLFGWLVRPLYGQRSYPAVGFLAYLGFTPLFLAGLGLTRDGGRIGRRALWVTLGAVLLILSLGQRLVLFGHDTGLPLPQGLFEGVPVLGLFRIANRFALWAQLPLAVLAAFGLVVYLRRGRHRLVAALTVLCVLEYLWLPYPVQPTGRHPYLEEIARDPEAGAVLTVPLPRHAPGSEVLYDQTRFRRPQLGGYTSYPRPQALETILSDPFLRGLADRSSESIPPDIDRLRRLGVGTVILFRERTDEAYRERLATVGADYYARRAVDPRLGFPAARLREISEFLRRAPGVERLFSDERIEVFRIE